jgi:hypothetical protein
MENGIRLFTKNENGQISATISFLNDEPKICVDSRLTKKMFTTFIDIFTVFTYNKF